MCVWCVCGVCVDGCVRVWGLCVCGGFVWKCVSVGWCVYVWCVSGVCVGFVVAFVCGV